MRLNGSVPLDWGDYLAIVLTDGKAGTFQEAYQNFSAWTDTKYPNQILTIEKVADSIEGDYSFKMDFDSSRGDLSCFARKIFDAPQTLVYAQTWFKVTQHSITGGHYSIFGLDSALGVDNNIGIDKDRRLVKEWQDDSGYHTSVSSTVIELNRWYHLKIMVKVGNGNGENRVWLDENEVMDLQNFNLVNTYSPVTLVYIGTTKTFTYEGTATVYYDSVYAGTNPETGMSRHNCVAYKIWPPATQSSNFPPPYSPLPVLYARTYIKVTEHTISGKHGIFGLLGVSHGNFMNLLSLDSNRRLHQAWRDDSGAYSNISSTTLSMNEWHSLEVSYKVGNGTGEARVWLDGNEVMDLQRLGLVNTVVNGATELEVGQDEMHLFDAGTATVYYDSVVVSTSYIGGPE